MHINLNINKNKTRVGYNPLQILFIKISVLSNMSDIICCRSRLCLCRPLFRLRHTNPFAAQVLFQLPDTDLIKVKQ